MQSRNGQNMNHSRIGKSLLLHFGNMTAFTEQQRFRDGQHLFVCDVFGQYPQ